MAEYLFTALFIFLATGTITSGCHTADTGGDPYVGTHMWGELHAISQCPQAIVCCNIPNCWLLPA